MRVGSCSVFRTLPAQIRDLHFDPQQLSAFSLHLMTPQFHFKTNNLVCTNSNVVTILAIVTLAIAIIGVDLEPEGCISAQLNGNFSYKF